MMDRKPWDNRDSHREGFGGRREWNSDREDRRFGGDRPRFGDDRMRFGGDRPRYESDRPRFGGNRRFGDDRPRQGHDRYSSKTGPRARAFNDRYQERDDYAKRQIVRIDASVAEYFPTAKDVNDALRLVIELTKKVRVPSQEPAPEVQESAAEALPEEAAEEAAAEMPVSAEELPAEEIRAEDKAE